VNLPIRDLPTPNQDDRPPDTPIDMLILHYTGMQSAREAIDRLCDPASRVSSHYIVDEDGGIWRLVPEERRAFHAGVSCWRGHRGLNGRSIGIEIVNPGHDWGYRDFPVLQLAATCDLCLSILARHPIPQRNVVGHSDVAPDRKQDPGERFDWAGLAANGVGLWPKDTEPLSPGIASAAETRAALADIGYCVADDDAQLGILLRAFQRHWRQEAITGEADPGTLARLSAVRRQVLAARVG
jgi:N-acetylmuramoyl-L-alanine amidase